MELKLKPNCDISWSDLEDGHDCSDCRQQGKCAKQKAYKKIKERENE